MKRILIVICLCVMGSFSCVYAESGSSKSDVKSTDSQYSVEVTIKDIPKGQQTLFIPIMIDTMILDFDKVALEGLSTQNILAVASSSKDKVGPGIGLLKFDEVGLPETLTVRAYLKPVGQGQTSVSLLKVANEPALPSKGAVINDEVTVSLKTGNEVEVTEKLESGKKKLVLSENKLTFLVQRTSQKEESIFIPIIFDRSVADIDETFGHAIIGPGIAAKSFSSGSLHEGGPGVEILLTEVADKDFNIDVDLVARKPGVVKFIPAFPQKGHTAIVAGPVVNISPTSISVVSSNVVVGK